MDKENKTPTCIVHFNMIKTYDGSSKETVKESVRLETQNELTAKTLATNKVMAKPVHKAMNIRSLKLKSSNRPRKHAYLNTIGIKYLP